MFKLFQETKNDGSWSSFLGFKEVRPKLVPGDNVMVLKVMLATENLATLGTLSGQLRWMFRYSSFPSLYVLTLSLVLVKTSWLGWRWTGWHRAAAENPTSSTRLQEWSELCGRGLPSRDGGHCHDGLRDIHVPGGPRWNYELRMLCGRRTGGWSQKRSLFMTQTLTENSVMSSGNLTCD